MPVKPKSFFYPVLSKFSSDYLSTILFQVEYEAAVAPSEQLNQIAVGYKIDLTSRCLRDFVVDNRAVFAFDVYCGDTMYRKLFTSKTLIGEILLEPAAVKGRVEVQAFIIALDASAPYALEEINGEYGRSSFEIDPGSPLAIAPSISFPIEFLRSSMKEIVKVQLDRTCGKNSYFIDLTAEQIVVHMGINSHAAFGALSASAQFKSTLFVSVYKDCVIAALEALCRGQQDMEYRWAEPFTDKLASLNKQLPRRDATFNDLNKLALDILGSEGYEKVVTSVTN
jgi:hypothetical protein